jgi:hypothetical protein
MRAFATKRLAWTVLLVALSAAAVSGCELVSGLDEMTVGMSAGAGASADGSTAADAGADGAPNQPADAAAE